MIVDLTRVHRSVNANKFEESLDVPPADDAPRRLAAAWMHQAEDRISNEAVIDEKVLVDIESGVLALEIADAVVGDPMTKHQILRPSRRANRVGLHEADGLECIRQRRRGKET